MRTGTGGSAAAMVGAAPCGAPPAAEGGSPPPPDISLSFVATPLQKKIPVPAQSRREGTLPRRDLSVLHRHGFNEQCSARSLKVKLAPAPRENNRWGHPQHQNPATTQHSASNSQLSRARTEPQGSVHQGPPSDSKPYCTRQGIGL